MATCRSCNAEIRWITTVNNKQMPLDPKPLAVMILVEGGKYRSVHGYVSHFATCPQGKEWRK